MARLLKLFSFVGVLLLGFSVLTGVGTSVYAAENSNEPIVQNVDDLDIQKMTEDQQREFLELIDNEVNKSVYSSFVDKERFKEALISLFDSSSDTYQDLEKASQQALPYSTRAAHGWISNSVGAAAINVALSALTGGIGAGLASYITKVGVSTAKKVFQSRVKALFVKWGIKVAAGYYGTLFEIAMNVADPGGAISKYIDKHDKIPNNGYWEFS
ncbi:hypothetical protein IGI96_002933 [Enterococcus sp. DIV0421]|uniref:hypothetical protein n=1 Tax=Enterococcus sp. DIV0421 TaxID=2774688 RepID=UPI003F1FC743